MPDRNRTRSLFLVVAVGDTGAGAAADLLAEAWTDPRTREFCTRSLGVAFVRESSAADRPSPGAYPGLAQQELTLACPPPVGESPTGRDGGVLGPLADALVRLADALLSLQGAGPAAQRAERLRLDVWIVGSLDDRFYRRIVLPAAFASARALPDRFAAVLGTGDTRNAPLQIIPAGASGNLKALDADSRREVAELLSRTALWARTAPAPRFLLLGGFTAAGRVAPRERRGCLKNLLALAVLTGLRHSDLNRHLGVPPGREDFVSVLELAVLAHRPGAFKAHVLSRVLGAVSGRLLAPDVATASDDGVPADGIEKVLASVRADPLCGELLTDTDGAPFPEKVDDQVPDFVRYVPGPPPGGRDEDPPVLPEGRPRPDPLRAQGTFLPRIGWLESLDRMDAFFDTRWEREPGVRLRCEEDAELPRRYYGWIRGIGVAGQARAGTALEAFRREYARLLRETPLHGLVPRIERAIRTRVLEPAERQREELAGATSADLPPPPSASRFRHLAGLVRDAIGQAVRPSTAGVWFLPLTGLAASFLWYVLPPPERWLVGLVPGAERFFPADPLRYSAARDIAYRTVQAAAAAALLVGIPLLYAVFRGPARVRWLTRSPWPRYARAGREGRRPDGPGAVPARRLGPVARALEEMREAFRRYWRSRLEYAARFWALRATTALEGEARACLDDLARFRAALQAAAGAPARTPGPEGSDPLETPLFDPETLAGFCASCRPEEPGDAIARALVAGGPFPATPGAWAEAVERAVVREGRDRVSRTLDGSETVFGLLSPNDGAWERCRSFFDRLPGLLDGGGHYGRWVPLEEDQFVEDTGTVIVGPAGGRQCLQEIAENAGCPVAEWLTASGDPNRVYAFRMRKGLAPATVAAYLGYELVLPEQPAPGAGGRHGDPENPWQPLAAGAGREDEP